MDKAEVEDKVLNKIKNLLKFKDKNNNATDGEIKNALKLADRLMTKYDLSIEDLEEFSQEVVEEIVNKTAKREHWENLLAESIQRLFNVKVLYHMKRDHCLKNKYGYKKYIILTFVGNKLDVSISSYMYITLRKTFIRMCKEYCDNRTDLEELLGINKNTNKTKRSYLYGISSNVYHRIAEMKNCRENVNEDDRERYNEIILIKDRDINNYLENKYGKLDSLSSRVSTDIDQKAAAKGYVDGELVDLGHNKMIG